MKNSILLLALLASASLAVRAEEKKEAAPPLGKLALLAGTWKGEADMNHSGKKEPLTISYKLTSGDSALVETMMPGTPHEMVTIYTRDKKDFVVTHYCMMQNQPRMRAKDTLADKKLDFEFVDATGLDSPNDPHMHSLSLVFTDDDHITETWTHYDDGKKVGEAVFPLTRQK